MKEERLQKQIKFIEEIDKLKSITRQNRVINENRKENDAEHSWHLAVMAFLLSEYADCKELDLLKVIKMVLIHDIVEIDAGDTFCYDDQGYLDKETREKKAAERLFNILPEDQAAHLWDLWREFEDMKTPEAQFAACLDRFQPLILNNNTQGHTWQRPGIDSKKVLQRNEPLKDTTPRIWQYVIDVVDKAVEEGILKP